MAPLGRRLAANAAVEALAVIGAKTRQHFGFQRIQQGTDKREVQAAKLGIQRIGTGEVKAGRFQIAGIDVGGNNITTCHITAVK